MIFFNISAFFFSYFSVTATYVIFLPKILQMLGYSAVQIGIVFAMAPFMRFLIPFLFLKHIELNKKVFHFALFSMCIASILYYFTIHNFYLFLAPNLLMGASLGLVLPYIETYAMEHLGKQKFGKSRLFGSIGFMVISIVLAKFLDDPMVGVYFFIFFVFLTMLFGVLVTHNNDHFKKASLDNDEKFELRKIMFVWISLFLLQISFGAFYNFFTIYETANGISLELTSYLWSFGVICEIIFFYFQAPLLHYNLINILKIGAFFTSIRWLLLFLFPDSIVISFASQSLHAITFALAHTAAISFLYTTYKNKKLAAQFYYGFSFGLGGFLGALIAGYFYGPYLYLYASAVALLSFLALFFHDSKPTLLKQNS